MNGITLSPQDVLIGRVYKALNVATAEILAANTAYLGIEPKPPIPPTDPPTDPPIPPTPPPVLPDPLAAIVRISSGNVGCSATVIGPRRPDGRWWVLTAAHCVSGPGQRWAAKFRDGRTMGFSIVNLDKRADWAWGVTDANDTVYPYALTADVTPFAGTRIWHAGFGVHIPANREDGTITSGPDSNGQVRMRMSVSSGDSGGGIVIDSDGKIVSVVCCTTRRGTNADVWGASPEAFNAGRRDTVDLWEWKPIEVPLHAEVQAAANKK